MRPGRSTSLSFGAAGIITVAASCREPTQMTVRITTGETCSNVSRVQTVVGPTPLVTQQRFEARYTTAATGDCDATGFVGTLVITPGESASGSILVAAGVRVGDAPPPDAASCAEPETAKRCIIARRSFAFIDHTSLSLPIHLDPLCVGQSCDPASTCFKGECVKADVTCVGDDCRLAEEQATGGATEAGTSDGGYDAELDGPGFEDASLDVPDGAVVVDGGPDATGGVFDPSSPACGSSGTAFCYAPQNGKITTGPCPGIPGTGGYCCQCKCGNGVVMGCSTTMSNMSCHPACP